MAARTLPGIGLTGGRAAGESGWADEMNANLLKLSALTQLSVKSRTTALPGSPTNGDIYIDTDNRVAVRDNGAWTYYSPAEGWAAWVQDEDTAYVFNGSGWVASMPLDVATFIAGKPTASETVLRYVFARPVRFGAAFAGSRAVAGAGATGSTQFSIQKNGSEVGTITIAAGGAAGVFSGTAAFVAGDILSVIAPATADGTLADISITLAGSR